MTEKYSLYLDRIARLERNNRGHVSHKVLPLSQQVLDIQEVSHVVVGNVPGERVDYSGSVWILRCVDVSEIHIEEAIIVVYLRW